jgi:hypothetical protein
VKPRFGTQLNDYDLAINKHIVKYSTRGHNFAIFEFAAGYVIDAYNSTVLKHTITRVNTNNFSILNLFIGQRLMLN